MCVGRGAARPLEPAPATPSCKAKTSTRIAYGEKEFGLEGVQRIIDSGTCDVLGFDPGRAEGLTAFRHAVTRIEAAGGAGQRPRLVDRDRLGGVARDQLVDARLPPVRAQAAARRRAVRAGRGAAGPHGRVPAAAARRRPRGRDRRGRRRPAAAGRGVMPDPRGLADRGVVVTGGAGGIGREVAAAYASAGARVAVVDLDADACAQVVAGLEGGAERHLALGASIADLDGQEAVLRRVHERVRPLRRARAPGRGAAPARHDRRRHRGGLGRPARRQPQGDVLPRTAGPRGCSASRGAAGGSSTSPPRAGGPGASAARSSTRPARAGSSR